MRKEWDEKGIVCERNGMRKWWNENAWEKKGIG
jgi:hypothetical protein